MASRIISHLRSSRLLLNSQLLASRVNLRSFHLADVNQLPMTLNMPALSPTMTEGTIIKWHKKEGDTYMPGDLLMEIQTDKAVMEYSIDDDGVIAKILVPDSSVVQVGDNIGVLALPGEDWKTVPLPEAAPKTTENVAPATPTPAVAPTQVAHEPIHYDGNMKIMPAARILLTEYQINPANLPEGPRGFLSKSDVKEYIIKNNLSPAPAAASQPQVAPVSVAPAASQAKTSKPAGPAHPEYEPDYEDIELSNMRRVIAKRLVLSKTTIPHSYITATTTMDQVIAMRKQMIAAGNKVSLNDFIIKAAALALKLVPEVNSNQVGDGFQTMPTADISIAVATDNGLITPIITSADQACVTKISERVKSLADKARKGKLQPHEFQGGSFSISNLGMFGISEFSAVINPPQAAILAVGGSKETFSTDMQKQTEASFTLSYDARCVELDRAFKFMNTFKYFLANPDLLVEQSQTF